MKKKQSAAGNPEKQSAAHATEYEMPKRVQEQGAEEEEKGENVHRDFDDEIRTLNEQIRRSADRLTEAKLCVERARVYVDMARVNVELADSKNDPALQQVHRLKEFEAEFEKAKLELDLKIATAEAKLENAKTERDRDRAEEDLDDVRKELREIKEQWPSKLAEKKADLERLFPLEVKRRKLPSVVFPDFGEFEQFLTKFPLDPRVAIVHPTEQADLLGRFNLVGEHWPVIRHGAQWTIDLELAPSLLQDGEIRPAATAILAALKNGSIYYLMLAVSGSGKTSAFADVARYHFVIYVQCTPLSEQGSVQRSRGYDAGFISMLTNCDKLLSKSKSSFEANTREARRSFMVEIVCRLSQLYMLAKAVPNLTPFEFYVHEKAMGDTWTGQLRDSIMNMSDVECNRLVYGMRQELGRLLGSDRQLVYAIDEIEAGAVEFVNLFDPDKSKNNGFLSPMIKGLASLEAAGRHSVIFTGTASLFERTDTIKSSLNKGSRLHAIMFIPQIFPNVSLVACKKFFTKLNVSDALNLDLLRDQQ